MKKYNTKHDIYKKDIRNNMMIFAGTLLIIILFVVSVLSIINDKDKKFEHNKTDCLSDKEKFLIETSQIPTTHNSDGCGVKSGQWIDGFTGQFYTNVNQFSVEYIIPIEEAINSGADKWDQDKINAFISDHDNFIIMSRSEVLNRHNQGLEYWMPML